MGFPNIKRKKLHFKSIEFFTVCLLKYFKNVVSKVLTEENEEYGGLKTSINKFQTKIYDKLKADPYLGLNGKKKLSFGDESADQNIDYF
jgi:hypothetical protein|tara:strand:- start:741 stop:1007 length:267 start_codon:yes stop_codon:yes gene_type:complete